MTHLNKAHAILPGPQGFHDPVDAITGHTEYCIDTPVENAFYENISGCFTHYRTPLEIARELLLRSPYRKQNLQLFCNRFRVGHRALTIGMAQGSIATESLLIFPLLLLSHGVSCPCLPVFLTACVPSLPDLVVRSKQNLSKRQHHQQLSDRRTFKIPQFCFARSEGMFRQKVDLTKHHSPVIFVSAQLGINCFDCFTQTFV